MPATEPAATTLTAVLPEVVEPVVASRPGLRRICLLAIAGAVLLGAAVVLPGPLRLVGGAAAGVTLYYALKDALYRWRGPYARAGTWLSVAWLGGISLAAALVAVLPLAEGRDPALTLTEPSLASPSLFTDHPLGTDTLGLDILSQLLYGARVSLIVAFGASILAFIIGTVIGMFAGYVKGLPDQIIGFITDCVLSFPALILLLAMVTFLTPSLLNITIALGVLAIPGYVRLARASTLTVSSREFVIASQTLGASNARILFRNLLPNVVPPLIAYSLIVMSFLIVAEASLSYLGLGIQRPNPTWGNLIAHGQTYLDTHPALVLIPSAALFLTVMSANYLGQRLQSRQGLA